MKTFSVWAASCLYFLAAMFSPCAQADSITYKTGINFQQELASPAGIDWNGPPLRSALANLSQAKQIAIVLDRRVDPDQTIEFSSGNVPLSQALKQLASRLKLGVSIFDGVVYLGPERVTNRLATVAAVSYDQTISATTDHRRTLTELKPLSSEDLATPRELLEQLGRDAGIEIAGLDKVPHDLWPALHFPAQNAASRAAVILAGFDLALGFDSQAKTARIVAMPENISLTRTYGITKNQLTQIEQKLPQLRITTAGPRLQVEGSFEDHEVLERLLRGEKVTRIEVRGGEQRYTLNVENQPVGAVAQALGSKIKMEVKFAPAVKEMLDERVSFKVDNATLEDLLKKMLHPANLDFELAENEIRIGLKK